LGFCHVTLRGPPPAGYPRELLTLGDHLKKRRLDLGLMQKEVARRLGVSKDTVRNWERSRTEPAPLFVSRIVEFLGYAPRELRLSRSRARPRAGTRGRSEPLDP